MVKHNKHIIKQLHTEMHHLKQLVTLCLLLFGSIGHLASQTSWRDEGFRLTKSGDNWFEFEFNVSDYTVDTLGNSAIRIAIPSCNSISRGSDNPMLPQHREHFTGDKGSSARLEVSADDWEQVESQGKRLCKAIPARPKENADSWQAETYASESNIAVATLKCKGVMRGEKIYELTITPVRQNRNGTIEVCRQLRGKIIIDNNNGDAEMHSMAAGLGLRRLSGQKSYSNSLAESTTAKVYLVVSPSQFRETLQPLVKWKRQEGYIVEEYYFNGATRETIKQYLQERYDQSTPTRPAPLFILLVGDNEEILQWAARKHVNGIATHLTDLYFAEFTGDYLPDALLGRLSASDTASLARIVEKTIAYEKCQFADTSHLHRSLLVAGKEMQEPAPTATNGQINYIKQKLTAHDPQNDTICFYNPSSDTMRHEIYNALTQGVGLLNYTAHCNSYGWQHPSINNQDIDTLPSDGHYFLAINNCCRANAVPSDCFGEHLLRKAGGGAIGVIGAGNETLWDEDYYWSVGCGASPTLSPSDDSTTAGAYDRLLHTNLQMPSQQAETQGQMLLAGNWAVTMSGSPYDGFYWEIYSLLGDPSLMPQIGVPQQLSLAVDSITAGDESVTLHGTAGARVAATCGDTLYGICIIGEDGGGTMHLFRPAADTMLFTATKQYHATQQTTMVCATPAEARVVATGIALRNSLSEACNAISIADSGHIVITLKNVGLQTATGVRTTTTLNGTTTTSDIVQIQHNQETEIAIPTFIVSREPSTEVSITIELTDSDMWQTTHVVDIVKPELKSLQPQLLHNSGAVSSLQQGKEYSITFKLTNRGMGLANDIEATLMNNGARWQTAHLRYGDTATVSLPFVATREGDDSLTLDIRIAHRTDTVTIQLKYAVDSTESIEAPNRGKTIKIYPNPAHNTVIISGFSEPTTINIYDMKGQRIAHLEAESGDVIQYETAKLRCGAGQMLIVETTARSGRREMQKLVIIE